MPIIPDTKDWTWVLHRVCPECNFDVRTFPREQAGSLIREIAANWGPVLAHPKVRLRPSDDRWSALEYACHVRDVLGLYEDRLTMMLEQEDPTYPNWDQDATAIEQRYGEQEPEKVAIELRAAADRLADSFDEISGAQWGRKGTRSDGPRFTIESFARYLIHDPVHHLHDVEQGYARMGQ